MQPGGQGTLVDKGIIYLLVEFRGITTCTTEIRVTISLQSHSFYMLACTSMQLVVY